MASFPAGYHMVMEAPDAPVFAVGYKYNRRKVICFVFNKVTGVTTPGRPYMVRWCDDNDHLCSRKVECPDVCSLYFNHCNSIDAHNHVCQFALSLEKRWVTTCGYFRIFTTVLGVCVVDCWKVSTTFYCFLNFVYIL